MMDDFYWDIEAEAVQILTFYAFINH